MVSKSAQTGKKLPSVVHSFMNSQLKPQFIEAFIVDMNGVIRGKRLPVSALPRLFDKGLCLPTSTMLLDIWGREVEATGMVLETGDADYICRPVEGRLRRLPWSDRPGGQLLLGMYPPDGEPFIGDPRAVAARSLERLRARGLRPVVATELEFRLFDTELNEAGYPRVPTECSRAGQRSQ